MRSKNNEPKQKKEKKDDLLTRIKTFIGKNSSSDSRMYIEEMNSMVDDDGGSIIYLKVVPVMGPKETDHVFWFARLLVEEMDVPYMYRIDRNGAYISITFTENIGRLVATTVTTFAGIRSGSKRDRNVKQVERIINIDIKKAL